MQKVRRRILPVLFGLYAIAYLDRANVAFAKLTMSADLGFSEAVFGLGAGLFFIGYLLLEIPGALIVQKWGGRLWFTRILVSWGICTILVGFVQNAQQFYVARLLLGVAEAGLFPGLVVYVNQWFPGRYRAVAIAGFVIATPVSLVLGAPISGLILQVDWLNLAGWRWMFILEGLPAVLFAFVTYFFMTDRPSQAKWLSAEERDWLNGELQNEQLQKLAHGKISVWKALRLPSVVMLALITFLTNIGIAGFFLWLPTTIHKASGLSPYLSATVSALPFAVGVVSVLLWGRSSDRTGRRILHTALPLLLSAIIFPITVIPGQPFGLVLFWLCLSSAAIYGQGPSFWVLPTMTLGASAAAAAVGLINSFGSLGSFVGPTVVGLLLTAQYPFSVAVGLLSLCFLLASVTTVFLGTRLSSSRQEGATEQGALRLER